MGSPKITPNTSTSMSNKLFLIACLVAGVASFASVAETEPCECSGSQGKAALQSYYPDDMGETCKPWDVGMDYCKAGGESLWRPGASRSGATWRRTALVLRR